MKAFYERFFLLSRAKQIALSVALIHLAILAALITHHLITCQWRTPKPILVKTIAPIKAAPMPTPAIPSKSNTAAAPTKTSPIPPKTKDKPKPISQKKPKESKTIAPPVATNTWKEIAQSLNTLTKDEPKTAVASAALLIPTKIPPSSEPTSYTEDPTYGEYLTAFLQNTLELPEYGDVKIQIEIDDFGQLVDCQILEAKSKKNASFLQETLPSLHFPVPQLGPFEKTKTISITFRNK